MTTHEKKNEHVKITICCIFLVSWLFSLFFLSLAAHKNEKCLNPMEKRLAKQSYEKFFMQICKILFSSRILQCKFECFKRMLQYFDVIEKVEVIFIWVHGSSNWPWSWRAHPICEQRQDKTFTICLLVLWRHASVQLVGYCARFVGQLSLTLF